eukprot:3862029-Pyramimonas_sp.AAC.1
MSTATITSTSGHGPITVLSPSVGSMTMGIVFGMSLSSENRGKMPKELKSNVDYAQRLCVKQLHPSRRSEESGQRRTTTRAAHAPPRALLFSLEQ